MQSSFQNTGYNHAVQTQILGPSGVKIFAGEDLSTFQTIKQVEIAKGYNKSNQISGGDNNNSKNKDANTCSKQKKNILMNKLFRLINTENNLNHKKHKDLEIWKLQLNKQIYNKWNKK